MRKISWLERAKATARQHSTFLSKDSSWSIVKTAQQLHRSHGGVSEDLMIVEYLGRFPKISEMRSQAEALQFIREMKIEMKKAQIERGLV